MRSWPTSASPTLSSTTPVGGRVGMGWGEQVSLQHYFQQLPGAAALVFVGGEGGGRGGGGRLLFSYCRTHPPPIPRLPLHRLRPCQPVCPLLLQLHHVDRPICGPQRDGHPRLPVRWRDEEGGLHVSCGTAPDILGGICGLWHLCTCRSVVKNIQHVLLPSFLPLPLTLVHMMAGHPRVVSTPPVALMSLIGPPTPCPHVTDWPHPTLPSCQ